MTNKVTVLRTKFFNDNLADTLFRKMLRARDNQQIAMENTVTNLSPKYQAVQDFNKGLSIDENPFTENTIDWAKYNTAWYDCFLIGLYAEQEESTCQ